MKKNYIYPETGVMTMAAANVLQSQSGNKFDSGQGELVGDGD